MLLGKNKKLQLDRVAASLIDALGADVFIVREGDCPLLTGSSSAEERLAAGEYSVSACKRGFSYIFPAACEHCGDKAPAVFEAKDEGGRAVEISSSPIEWTDGKPATVFVVRDVEDERAARERMYQLAYVDQLTGVPNRQRLKEDFSQLLSALDTGKLCGLVAIMDMDNFKNINDTYGHNTGDAMLRRLTSHLENDPDFKGHIYRLGGDEFVLLFSDNPRSFKTTAEMRDAYIQRLSKALQTYTMPGIEDCCTLSMGVAFFPAHGEDLSELLRKADIALYRAKGGGRNQVVQFEDKYDAAKKFKDMYINMQPILLKTGKTFGYELIDGDQSEKKPDDVMSLSEFDRTLDALGLSDIKDDTRFFISFTKQLFNKSALRNIPKDKFVIQIPASDKCSDEMIKIYKQLRTYGYALALTGVDGGNANKNLLAIVDYVKFSRYGISASEQSRLIAANPGKTFIAASVSNGEELAAAERRGFKLFQGYYFKQQSVTKREKDVEPLKANYFRLIQLTSTDDYVDFNEISAVISSDVALSYKLLKLLNSASVGLRYRISSILMAVTYLGEETLKKWISVLALRGIADEKPLELVRMSLIRAHFGELLAPQLKPRKDPRHVFMAGLLSLLHIALEKSREELLSEIPVADEIRQSLLGKDGPYSELLQFFQDYEYSNWEEITRFAEKNALTGDAINSAYIESVKWCNDLISNS